jgi:hypothetical protein
MTYGWTCSEVWGKGVARSAQRMAKKGRRRRATLFAPARLARCVAVVVRHLAN